MEFMAAKAYRDYDMDQMLLPPQTLRKVGYSDCLL